MKTITLNAEARARIARQFAETNGVAVVCNGQIAALSAAESDQFRVG